MSLASEYYFVLAGVILLAVATLAPLFGRRGFGLAAGLYAGVTVTTGIAIAGRWLRESQGPFLTLYDVLLSNVFSLALLVFVIGSFVSPARAATTVASPLLLLLGIWLLNAPAEAVPLPATFDNYWLWAHVLSGKFFLGFCLVAACLAALALVQGALTGPRFAQRAEDVRDREQALWALFFVAFVFHSFMLVAGAVWAHSAWGRYWSWDPLETWTLVTWLMLGGILHARATFRNMPAGLAHVLVLAVFTMAFLTFFGVPFFSVAPHKGIM